MTVDPYDPRFRLIPDIIPASAWYSNVREQFPAEWDMLRRAQYRRADYRCEICARKGSRYRKSHPVECHEVWAYNEVMGIQRLERLIALCPDCHHVKHPGFWGIVKGHMNEVLDQLALVNGIGEFEARELLNTHWRIYERRSARRGGWVTDMGVLSTRGVERPSFVDYVFGPILKGTVA